MNQQTCCEFCGLAAAVPDCAKLALPADICDAAMAATRELLRRGVQLACMPTSGLRAGILIGFTQ